MLNLLTFSGRSLFLPLSDMNTFFSGPTSITKLGEAMVFHGLSKPYLETDV